MDKTLEVEVVKEPELEPAMQPALQLSEEDKKTVANYVSTIDICDTQMVMQYGVGAQRQIADFSESSNPFTLLCNLHFVMSQVI